MIGRSLCLLAFALVLAPGFSSGQKTQKSPALRLPAISDFVSPPSLQPPLREGDSSFAHNLSHHEDGLGLRHLTRAAGIIFAGTVRGIERRPAARGQSVETVTVTFHVEHALRGVTPGEDLTISQWIGLWSSGQRYRVGEHLFLFLYPRSKLGLTSCVASPVGRFPIDALGRVVLSTQHLAAFQKDPVLGGKSRVRFSDFALAVRQASEEE
jgi:hypothetical protein